MKLSTNFVQGLNRLEHKLLNTLLGRFYSK
jgi:hypothetical protein